ncbi:hypothetical protein [Streptomyces sp. A0592]|nr:hypothetical protein [Streptomyces sp. A0592]
MSASPSTRRVLAAVLAAGTPRDDRGNIVDTETWGRRGHHDDHRR